LLKNACYRLLFVFTLFVAIAVFFLQSWRTPDGRCFRATMSMISLNEFSSNILFCLFSLAVS